MVSSDPKQRRNEFGAISKKWEGGNFGLHSLLKKSREPDSKSKSSSNEFKLGDFSPLTKNDPNCHGVDCSIVQQNPLQATANIINNSLGDDMQAFVDDRGILAPDEAPGFPDMSAIQSDGLAD